MFDKLINIAEISSGYNFPKKVEENTNGNCRYIQLKDVGSNCGLNTDNLVRIKINHIKDNAFIKKNDILFKAKSNNNIACVVPDEFDNLVASAHFFVLRMKRTDLLPEYIAWYMNQMPAQKYFEIHSGGSTISVITKKTLGALFVKILPIDQQEKITHIAKLRQKELELKNKINALDNKWFNQRILKLIK